MQRGSRIVYLIATWLFLLGVVVQVFFAGMAAVAVRMSWANHVQFGHMLALPLLVMLITSYLGRLPTRMKGLTWLLLGVYIVQADVIIFMRTSFPVISAFHPVLALVDFALALTLALRAWSLIQQDAERFEVQPGLEH